MLDELSIINSMLASTGVERVTSSASNHPDYLRAKQKLDEVIVSVLKLGQWYNTSYPTLAANTSGEIVLPAGTLHCDPCDTSLNYVKRGTKLYDQDNRTFIFGTDFTVQVKLVSELTISEMPETAKDYLKARARYEFYLDEDGDDSKLARYEKEKLTAWRELYREHLRNRDVNATHSPSSRMIARGRRWVHTGFNAVNNPALR